MPNIGDRTRSHEEEARRISREAVVDNDHASNTRRDHNKSENIIADTLSRIEEIDITDYNAIATAQINDEELKELIQNLLLLCPTLFPIYLGSGLLVRLRQRSLF
ncbi:hypothetical protein ACJJTC_006116 [Scirpophaga incertulas]